jgi:hypothetical protein
VLLKVAYWTTAGCYLAGLSLLFVYGMLSARIINTSTVVIAGFLDGGEPALSGLVHGAVRALHVHPVAKHGSSLDFSALRCGGIFRRHLGNAPAVDFGSGRERVVVPGRTPT